MHSPTQPPVPEPLARLRPSLQWALLIALSVLFAGLLEGARLPAALLVGPMMAAIVCGTNGARMRVPQPAFGAAQTIVGCLVAASIEPEILSAFLDDWPLFLLAVIATVCASSFLGYLISRWKVLPGTTAVWGSAPGAATAMVLMADAFGADARLVAFMQYLRVIFVSVAAALIARMFVDTSDVEAPALIWFPDIDGPAFAATILVAVAGGSLGYLLRLPSPYFLGTMMLGATVHLGAGITMQLPEWLLAISYALVGWSIGLNFNRAILRHATRALRQIVLSILALMVFCGGLAWLLVLLLDIDPLTAYLATSPGGMDSVAIIAAASDTVNISFIMALQMVRFLFVLIFGPPISRLVARRIGG
ncbi:ammonia monooxygenase [Mesorhizobium sp. L-8-10]|uniref:AbrB family transcriptional regulator n=1 Tax=Mesorhizobium sp. L-8-10 TaxID=2744523 RepID=UPI001925A6EC|nr:AbrB family transcriptional regulator [Mesorhizobium sp. L-8-10]BCH31343.1 ammonia monooxygenase [Mesorhizobium sp. L-8-10]